MISLSPSHVSVSLIALSTLSLSLSLSFSLLPSPREGTNLTPAHHYMDFRFKTYAPIAFRYFRDMYGIRPDDYMVFFLCLHLWCLFTMCKQDT